MIDIILEKDTEVFNFSVRTISTSPNALVSTTIEWDNKRMTSFLPSEAFCEIVYESL